MSSLIPKISIGQDLHNSKFDFSCMTHTTSEIGYVSPVMSKVLVPRSKVRLGTRTGSRLSPLFVPTMGQLDIRHYHVFVPFSTIWFPWDAFLTNTNYTLSDGTTYTPKKVPYFTVRQLLKRVLNFQYYTGLNLNKYLTGALYIAGHLATKQQLLDMNTVSSGVNKWDKLFSLDGFDLGFVPKYIKAEDGIVQIMGSNSDHFTAYDLSQGDIDRDSVLNYSYPSYESCDFMDGCTDSNANYAMAMNFNGPLKRLRTIFMGLGYSFNPFDTQPVTILKLLAYYKTYWSLFGVNRSVNFYNTYCYKLIKRLSEKQISDMYEDISDSLTSYDLLVYMLIYELSECTYTCPSDYFSSSDTDTQRGANGQNVTIKTPTTRTNSVLELSATTSSNTTPSPTQNSALSQQLALRLLRFINKNSVIGRQVSELLRSRYGVTDVHNTTHEQVIRIGASSVPVQISAIYNQNDGGEMPLGSYAGLGVGSHRSKMLTFKTEEFGVLLSLVAVVPKMGYFQGMFRENTDGVNDRFDFWTPEFDALGYQAIRYNEMIADRQFKNQSSADSQLCSTDLGIFGYTPRYSHYKVSFNRCLADISLPSKQDSMLPYTLDRFFKQRVLVNLPNNTIGHYNADLPVNDPQTFRSGTQGQTNRIFSSYHNTDDHVIMQIFFDFHVASPMKPLATSYDTWDEESTHSIDVSHE